MEKIFILHCDATGTMASVVDSNGHLLYAGAIFDCIEFVKKSFITNESSE